MQLFLLTTCGTSLLTNGASQETRGWLASIANRHALEKDELARLDGLVAERRQVASDPESTGRWRRPAELDGIDAVVARARPARLQHMLLHSDTRVGEACARFLADSLEGRGQDAQLLTVPGLRTDDSATFRDALAHLARELETWSWRSAGWSVWFNLTGGFKSVNAFVQALGMLHADRCVFLFEGARELLEIPRLPVRLVETEELRVHLTVFRRLEAGYAVKEEEAVAVPGALLLCLDGVVATSVWGDVVWSRVRRELLGERLLEPLSEKLVLGGRLRADFDGLELDRKVQVNEALDAMSSHLDGVQALMKSRTFRKLQGDPTPPSTHELYAWSDGDARRLFGHYDDGRFVIDRLGRHLP